MDLLDIAIAFGAPAYVILQIGCIVVARLEGGKIAFLLPLVFSLPIAAWCLYALAQGSNLWLLPFVLFGPFGALYLVAVLIVRSILPPRRRASDDTGAQP